MIEKWVPEQLETIQNLCRLSKYAIEKKDELALASAIEYMHAETQGLIDKQCIKQEG